MPRIYNKIPFGISSRINGKQNPEYHKIYYEVNKEKRLAKQKEWRERTKFRTRCNAQEYKKILINVLLQRDGNICSLCNKELDNTMSIDHIKLVSKGGDNSAENIRLVHLTCNLRRSRSGEN